MKNPDGYPGGIKYEPNISKEIYAISVRDPIDHNLYQIGLQNKCSENLAQLEGRFWNHRRKGIV